MGGSIWTCLTARRIIGAACWMDRLIGVPGAVAVVYFGEPLFHGHKLAVWAGGHDTEGLVVMTQKVSMLASASGAGSNFSLRRRQIRVRRLR